MNRLDRYIVRQLVAAFGFFALVFTGVVWLTQAVRLIDTVIASGQSARVFLEFSALVLPQVFVIVLPLSGIGAALYALNKLYSETELIVMMSAGLGPAALLRPVAVFGAMIGAGMAAVMLLLVPYAGAILGERTQAIRSDLANALIVERQFLHPMPGLTLFIADTSRAGEMAGIFLHDQREMEAPVTYSAERALLVARGRRGAARHARRAGADPGRRRARAQRRALRPVRVRPERADPRPGRPGAAAGGIFRRRPARPDPGDARERALHARRTTSPRPTTS